MTESSENQNIASQDVQSGSYNRGKIDKNEIEFPLGNAITNSPAFTGTPYIQNLIPLEDVYNFPESNEVSFEPGARSNWHRHGGMVVLVTAGVGYYQEEGKKAQILRPGDVVYISEDENTGMVLQRTVGFHKFVSMIKIFIVKLMNHLNQ